MCSRLRNGGNGSYRACTLLLRDEAVLSYIAYITINLGTWLVPHNRGGTSKAVVFHAIIFLEYVILDDRDVFNVICTHLMLP